MSGHAENISEVFPGIFRIVVQLPIPEVGSVNAYIVDDGSRNLIIDPGMAHPACYEIMEKAIGDLGLDLERTDFFITHHHLDHFSSVSRFLGGTSRIYISRAEAEFIERIASGEAELETAVFLERMGFPEKKPMHVVSQFFSDAYSQRSPWPFQYVADGDVIERGGYHFTCIVSPGHSMAHICLYESDRRALIAGDQITAGIQFLLDRHDPLTDHFQSLIRLREMDVKLALPGHGPPFKDHRKRIDSLRTHHRVRLEAVYSALGKKGADAYEITLALDGLLPDWDSFDMLPPHRKFIYTRHTFAYLQHLATRGRIERENRHGRILFFR